MEDKSVTRFDRNRMLVLVQDCQVISERFPRHTDESFWRYRFSERWQWQHTRRFDRGWLYRSRRRLMTRPHQQLKLSERKRVISSKKQWISLTFLSPKPNEQAIKQVKHVCLPWDLRQLIEEYHQNIGESIYQTYTEREQKSSLRPCL